ncbi:MAG TPA: bifunctional metallophosphatase/5'-nucleotidase, partial [Polyangiaceae bacterium]|nr:bifunctional metallophosphatase/5'-nucleotidase [Polyangiaceae bacterium]
GTAGASGSGGAAGGGGPAGGGGGAGGGVGGAGGGGGVVDVRLLAFNDFHGNLEALKSLTVITKAKTDTTPEEKVEAGGAAYLAAHVAALRQGQPNTLVVSAGDLIGGTPLTSALFHDEPTIEAMNALGLTVNGVGNHEFDEGRDELLRIVNGGCHPVDQCDFTPPGAPAPTYDGADFAVLAANVVVEATGQTLLPPTHVVERGGAKVAFVGLTLEGTPSVVTQSAVAGLSFRDEVETVNALVPGLKAQGADAVVVVVHQGGVQKGLYNECVDLAGDIVAIAEGLDPAVDVVVSGHTHQAYNCTVGGKLVTSALSAGRVLTAIDLRVDRAAHAVVAKSAENHIVTRDVAPDPTVAALLDVTLATAGPLANRVVGQIEADILHEPTSPTAPSGETPLGDLIADAQLAATSAPDQGSAQIAFMNPGGIRAPLLFSPGGTVADGNVTYGALFAVQPFGNYLVTMTLTGRQIETLLEQQVTPLGTERGRILQVSNGFTYAWDPNKFVDAAARKPDIDPATIKLNGVTLDPNGSYRVTVNSFLAGGGDGFAVLKEGASRLDGGDDLVALEAYVAAHSPVAVPPADRITRLP